MGRALAIQLVREGCSVAVCDVRDEELAQTKQLCQEAAVKEVRVSTHHCDVTSSDEIRRFRDQVENEHGDSVNLLFNNAGLAGTGSFLEMSRERFDKIFAVSFTGTVECTRAFLPMLVKSKSGYVVNLSSVNAWWNCRTGQLANQDTVACSIFCCKGCSCRVFPCSQPRCAAELPSRARRICPPRACRNRHCFLGNAPGDGGAGAHQSASQGGGASQASWGQHAHT